jgi:hypothetical protein
MGDRDDQALRKIVPVYRTKVIGDDYPFWVADGSDYAV